MSSHKSVPFPRLAPSRNAISAETPLHSDKTACRVWREMPRLRANLVAVKPKCGMTSLRRMAPGWLGLRVVIVIMDSSVLVFAVPL